MGILWSFDEETQLMLREGIWSSHPQKVSDSILPEKSIAAPKDGLTERVWVTGDPAWGAKINATEFPLPPISIKANVRGAGCFPIKSKGHILGAMEFVGQNLTQADAHALEMTSVIGNQIGLFIERIRAMEAMRECEARYRCLADTDTDVLVTIDEDINLVFVNKASEQVFGYTQADLLKNKLTLLIPDYLERKPGLEKDTKLDPSKQLEMMGVRKNGESVDLEVSFAEFTGKWKRFAAGVLRDITERKRTQHALKETERKLRFALANSSVAHIVVESPPMLKLMERVKKAAASEAAVAIQGETGSGKECIAQLLHQQSPRASKPFVARNCAAIPAEIFESEMFGHRKGAFTGADRERKGAFLEADGGTLFLDEIGDLEYSLQSKLLRAIQEKVIRPVGSDKDVPVDARIVCATNKDLRECCKTKEFREDLYYRLANVVVIVPPLRERRDDILPLARHFVALASKGTRTLSPATEARLLAYTWPGNVRELRSLMEQSVIFAIGNEIQPEELNIAATTSGAISGSQLLADVERRHIVEVLKNCDGNKSEAAELLGLARSTLVLKLKGYPGSNGDISDSKP
jgi:two-component system response regulator HydG